MMEGRRKGTTPAAFNNGKSVQWGNDIPEEYGGLHPGDEEEHLRREYEKWELEQPSSRSVSERDWKELNKFPENNKIVVKSKKRPKEETQKEKWERIQEEKEEKENKKIFRDAKKMRREGTIKRIDSYFKK